MMPQRTGLADVFDMLDGDDAEWGLFQRGGSSHDDGLVANIQGRFNCTSVSYSHRVNEF